MNSVFLFGPAWIVIAFIVFAFLYLQRKNKHGDLYMQVKALERFQSIHKEVLPLLTTKEKNQMLEVLQNTVANSQLFKNNRTLAKSVRNIQKSENKDKKRVTFKV